jgi:hypothetical protein
VMRIGIILCSCGGVLCWDAGICLLPGEEGVVRGQGVLGWLFFMRVSTMLFGKMI